MPSRTIFVAASAVFASILAACSSPSNAPPEHLSAASQTLEGCHDDSLAWDNDHCTACHFYTCYLSGGQAYRDGSWCENGMGSSCNIGSDGSHNSCENWFVDSCKPRIEE
jgi:hypothetical protein